MYRLLFLWLLLLISSEILAGEKDSTNQDQTKYDTNYIKSYRDWFHITAVSVNKQTGLSMVNINETKDLSFSTNNPFEYGLAIDYEWITFEYTHTIKGLEFANKKKGESSSSSLRFGLTGRKFRMSTFYRYTIGFHMENVEDWVPDWFDYNNAYPYHEDLESFVLAFSLYYTFNHKRYSNTAALWQIDRQLKSAGSPVIGFQTNLEGIFALSPLFTSDSLSKKFLNVSEAANFKVGLTGGYMHTFAIKKRFYIHLALLQGFLYSVGTTTYFDSEESIHSKTLGISIYGRITAGYNGDKWYGGFFYVGDAFINDVLSDNYESTSYDYYRIYVGYRFPIKKRPWMKKFYL